ncbi:MAG: hypothetical protein JNK82_13980 [Myxococcaceae bacterium]|nr:hypothetical protein [Myxococcaceae bacterium]
MECQPGRELLSQGPGCRVERCSCGTLHVTLGAVTLRMEPEVLQAMMPALNHAVTQLPPGEPRFARAQKPPLPS